jgi:nicotinamide N-methyltransferase
VNDYSNFRPRTYLEEYYSTVPTESRELMAFLVHAFSRIPMNSSVLDFGTGPTLYSPMAASRRDARVVCSDYTPANRDEIRAWWKGDPNAFDWREHVHVMMDLEQGIGATTITETMIREREAQIRRCIVDVVHCDALRDPVLDGGYSQFDVIVSNLCLEAAARNLEEWHGCMARVSALLRPGG